MSDAPAARSPDPVADRLPPPPMAQQARMVEALLFASAHPLSVAELAAFMPDGCQVRAALDLVQARYRDSGVQVVRVGTAWAFRTAADLAGLMTSHVREVRKLSRAATETLAIIAYHQPVTRAEIEEIRGVAVSRGTLDQLLELNWIGLGKRKAVPGRPVTFVVTRDFLDHFDLRSTSDLPGLAELRAAGLLESRAGAGGSDAATTMAPNDDLT